MFNTFDAPTGESCTARRNQSNTALQALTLLNDVMFVEIAQHLGDAAFVYSDRDAKRAEFIFRRILTRPPSKSERSRLIAFVELQRERIEDGSLDGTKVASTGQANAKERATWTLLARALFALDENITRN